MAQLVKNLPAMWETWVPSLDWEDPLENGMATHSSILAWRLPWTMYSSWGRKESDMTFTSLERTESWGEAQKEGEGRAKEAGMRR